MTRWCGSTPRPGMPLDWKRLQAKGYRAMPVLWRDWKAPPCLLLVEGHEDAG